MTSPRPILLDGATGTMLRARGFRDDVAPMLANRDAPDLVRQLATDFVRAGARIVTTNTFYNESPVEEELVRQGVVLAREGVAAACEERVQVAGDVGPLLPPSSHPDELVERITPWLVAFEAERPDVVLIESQTSVPLASAATRYAREVLGDTPILVGFAFRSDGRTFDDHEPEAAARAVADAGADAVGVCCSDGPRHLLPIAERLLEATPLPLWAKPSAGLPREDGTYRLDAEAFAQQAAEFASLGAAMIGGCCGTTPECIRELARALSE